MRLPGWVAVAILPLAACADLTPIAEGVCGNTVVEAGEDCDRVAAVGTCGPPDDSVRACRFVCTGGAACPDGWACAENGLCDYATGQYREAAGSLLPIEAYDIAVTDVDGDSRGDLVGWSDRRIFVRPGAGDGRFPVQSDTGGYDGRFGPATVTDLDADGRADAIVGELGGMTVLAGTAAGTLDPVTHAAFLLQQPDGVTGIGVRLDPYSPFNNPLVLNATGSVFLLAITNVTTNTILMTLALPDYHKADDVIALEAGDIDTDPAQGQDEFLLGFTGETRIRAFGTDAGNIVLRADIPLPAELAAGRFADVDGDGRTDVVATLVGGQVAVALGDGAGGFAAAVVDARFNLIGPPIAAGDIDGDGVADFVGAGGIFLSVGGNLVQRAWPILPSWQLAAIADYNRDGLLDVAGTGPVQTVEILYGAPGGWFTRSFTQAAGQPRIIRAGDFDGDRITDLALVVNDGESDTVAVLFGTTEGPPVPPVLVGRMPHIEHMQIANFSVGDVSKDVAQEILLLATDSDTPAPSDPRAVAVLIGTPDRRMFSPFSVEAVPLRLIPGQFTADAAPDVAVISAAGVSFVQGRGVTRFHPEDLHLIPVTAFTDGTFEPACALWTSGDVDGDGRDELIGLSNAITATCAARQDGQPSALLVARFSGTDAAPTLDIGITSPAGDLRAPRELTAVDLDLDGRTELLAVFAGEGCDPGAAPATAGVGVYPNEGGDVLADPAVIAGVAFTSMTALNTDYSPALELALTTSDGVYTTFRDPTGALTPPTQVAALDAIPICPLAPARVVARDVTRDGLADLTVFDGARVRVFSAIAHHEAFVGLTE